MYFALFIHFSSHHTNFVTFVLSYNIYKVSVLIFHFSSHRHEKYCITIFGEKEISVKKMSLIEVVHIHKLMCKLMGINIKSLKYASLTCISHTYTCNDWYMTAFRENAIGMLWFWFFSCFVHVFVWASVTTDICWKTFLLEYRISFAI